MNSDPLEYFDDEDRCFVFAKLQKDQFDANSSLQKFRIFAAERKHILLKDPSIESDLYVQNVKIEVDDLNEFSDKKTIKSAAECVTFIRLRVEESYFNNEFPRWGMELLSPNKISMCLSYRDTTFDDGIVEMLLADDIYYVYFYLWW